MAVKPKFTPIKYGAEGKEVKECQKALKQAGSTIQITGKFTIGMVSAVKSFQKKHGLKITGAIDAKTFLKLAEYLKPAARKGESKK